MSRGQTTNPERNVPRAFYASAAMACLFFVAVPVVWLGVLGAHPLEGDLAQSLAPAFAPLLGERPAERPCDMLVLSMFHGRSGRSAEQRGEGGSQGLCDVSLQRRDRPRRARSPGLPRRTGTAIAALA